MKISQIIQIKNSQRHKGLKETKISKTHRRKLILRIIPTEISLVKVIPIIKAKICKVIKGRQRRLNQIMKRIGIRLRKMTSSPTMKKFVKKVKICRVIRELEKNTSI